MTGTDWSPEDLSYVAGYLDGEGCLAIGQNSKVTVVVGNTHRPTIEWLRNTFGGCVSKGRRRLPHHRPVYTWSIVSNPAVRMLKAVAPYMREKTGQALLLIVLDQTKHLPKIGRRLDPEVVEERERLATIFKGMRHVET